MEKSTNSSSALQGLTKDQKSKFRTYKSRYINERNMPPAEAEAAALRDVLNPKRKYTRKAKVAAATDIVETQADVREPLAMTGSDGRGIVLEFPRSRSVQSVSATNVDVAATKAAQVMSPACDDSATSGIVTPDCDDSATSPFPPSKNDVTFSPLKYSYIVTPDVTTVAAAPSTETIEQEPIVATAITNTPEPIVTHPTTISFVGAQKISWNVATEKSATMPLQRAKLQAALSGPAFFVCLTALVILQARVGGFTFESMFWSLLSEVAGVVLWVYPARELSNKIVLRLLGSLFIAVGFLVMHTGVKTGTETLVDKVVSNTFSVQTLEEQIRRKKDSISSLIAARNKLPENRSTMRTQIQSQIDDHEKNLVKLENTLIHERKIASSSPSTSTVELTGYAEDARRVLLIVLCIVAGHGFFAAFPVLLQHSGNKELDQLV